MIISKDTILNDRICMNVFFSVRRMTIQIMKAIKEYFSLIFCPFAMIQVNSKVVFYPQDHFEGPLTGAGPAPKGQIGFHCGLLQFLMGSFCLTCDRNSCTEIESSLGASGLVWHSGAEADLLNLQCMGDFCLRFCVLLLMLSLLF